MLCRWLISFTKHHRTHKLNEMTWVVGLIVRPCPLTSCINLILKFWISKSRLTTKAYRIDCVSRSLSVPSFYTRRWPTCLSRQNSKWSFVCIIGSHQSFLILTTGPCVKGYPAVSWHKGLALIYDRYTRKHRDFRHCAKGSPFWADSSSCQSTSYLVSIVVRLAHVMWHSLSDFVRFPRHSRSL